MVVRFCLKHIEGSLSQPAAGLEDFCSHCSELLHLDGILIPMLLEYLSEDAASSGLESTWQLKSWIGFIIGLFFASLVGFQIPLAVLLMLRYDLVERRSITENREILWFAALAFGALLSPPDPLSLFLVGGPVLVLLEVALVIARLSNRD